MARPGINPTLYLLLPSHFRVLPPHQSFLHPKIFEPTQVSLSVPLPSSKAPSQVKQLEVQAVAQKEINHPASSTHLSSLRSRLPPSPLLTSARLQQHIDCCVAGHISPILTLSASTQLLRTAPLEDCHVVLTLTPTGTPIPSKSESIVKPCTTCLHFKPTSVT